MDLGSIFNHVLHEPVNVPTSAPSGEWLGSTLTMGTACLVPINQQIHNVMNIYVERAPISSCCVDLNSKRPSYWLRILSGASWYIWVGVEADNHVEPWGHPPFNFKIPYYRAAVQNDKPMVPKHFWKFRNPAIQLVWERQSRKWQRFREICG